MPNWVKNVLCVSGTPEELKEFKEFVAGPESVFDFNKIVPMSKDLKVESGNFGDAGLAILYFRETDPVKKELINKVYRSRNMFFKDIVIDYKDMIDNFESAVDKDKKISLGKKYLENYIKYGATDWHDWCCNNWGTKWNAVEARTLDHTSEYSLKSYVYYEFNTAWSMPLNIFKILGKQFPSISIDWEYADEDIGNNCGHWECVNGKFHNEDLEENSRDFASCVWGYDNYSDLCNDSDELEEDSDTTISPKEYIEQGGKTTSTKEDFVKQDMEKD